MPYRMACICGGDKADPRAIHEASIRDVDMQNHITRNISKYKEQKGDFLIVMEPSHLVELNTQAVKYGQITIAPLWSENITPYLSDPFTANTSFFSHCESVVEQCVEKIHTKLNT